MKTLIILNDLIIDIERNFTRHGFPLKDCGNDGKNLNLLALTLTWDNN